MKSSKQQNILQKTHKLLIENGLKSVSMEDIARASNVSKKELYDEFENKENLIHQTIHFGIIHISEKIKEFQQNSSNAIEEMVALNNYVVNHYATMNPVVFYDLEKYYPAINKYQTEKRDAIMLDFMRQNIERGLTEKVYRTGMHKEIACKLWLEKIKLTKNHENFPHSQFSFHTLLLQLSEFQLRALVNTKGATLISKYLNEEEE